MSIRDTVVPSPGRGVSPDAAPASPWLLTARVTPPERVRGYFRRPELLDKIAPAGKRRVAVVKAPGGFGKTTLLADLCRRLRERGWVAAWLTLTEDDTPGVLGAYLAYAFARAGLDPSVLDEAAAAAGPPRHDGHQTALLTRAIEAHAARCLLVLDDADRPADREAVETINGLLRHAPANLHVAVGCRRNPGLDVDAAVLAGAGVSVGAEQLRFSPPEIARFFDLGLPRDDLRKLVERTEGWPVALQLYRNLRAGETARGAEQDFRGDKGLAATFLGERLLRNLSDEDRGLLLDLALFDWIDPALVDEALETGGTRRRLAALSELDGLLHDRGEGVLRLHPLIREYCVARRFRDAPDRFRWINGRIARAMAHRGLLVPAVRHARDAGDEGLVGDVVERAGGLQLWCTEGVTRLHAIDRLLPPAVLETHPRVALLHGLVQALRGRFDEARATYDAAARRTAGFTRDRDGGDDRRLRADGVLLRTMLAAFGCLPIGHESVGALIAEVAAVADDEDHDPAIRGACNLVLCGGNYQRGRFEASRRRGLEARALFDRCGSRYGVLQYGFHAGLEAMARGRAQEAADHYANSRRLLERHFPEDGGSASILDVLTSELDLERNRLRTVDRRPPDVSKLRRLGAWFDVYAAAYRVAAEIAFFRRGVDAAMALLDTAREHAGRLGLASLARYLSALHVSFLVAGGRPGDAAAVWRGARLPDAEIELTDLRGQTWREMEAAACARARLLAARGDFSRARGLAARLCAVARESGLGRTLMRGLAAAIVVEHRAGAAGGAVARMTEFVAALGSTDYPRPLVRERAVSLAVLPLVRETAGDPAVRERAAALIEMLEGGAAGPAGEKPESAAPAFTPREVEVLEQLAAGAPDREIAARLGLTVDGVRYHLRRIYRKTRSPGRTGAVERARSLGVVS